MGNKSIFKKMYSEKINKNKNYAEVLNYMEKNSKKKSDYWKWSVVLTCIVVITTSILLLQHSNLEDKPDADIDNYVRVNINKVDIAEAYRYDADIKVVSNYYMIPAFDVLTNIKVPDGFGNAIYYKAIFGKSTPESDNYDKIINYVFSWQDDLHGRVIDIGVSKENKPIRDYYFSTDESKVSNINGLEFVIYQYNKLYMTEFTYKDTYIDIETANIEETDFISLLQSIIK